LILNKFILFLWKFCAFPLQTTPDYCPKSAITLTALPMIDAEAGVLRDLSIAGSLQGRNPDRRQ
jgi:hypothetical protein